MTRRSEALPARRRETGRYTAPFESGTVEEVGRCRLETVDLGGVVLTRLVAAPGWRWSIDVGPTVGADRCPATHVGYMAAGRMRISYPSTGEAFVLEPGAAFAFGGGHDSETIGDEPAVLIWAGDRATWPSLA